MATERVEDQSREETKVLRAPHRIFLGQCERELLEQIWGTMLNWNEGFQHLGAAISRIESKLGDLGAALGDLEATAGLGDGDVHV